jgi:hypothetical protein
MSDKGGKCFIRVEGGQLVGGETRAFVVDVTSLFCFHLDFVVILNFSLC